MLSVVLQSNDQLNPLELTPTRVLVVAAHPGDIEFAASAAIAKWTQAGAEVTYLVATRGELSIPGIEPEDAALIRSGEQSAAAAAVGVRNVDFLDVDDGSVEPTVQLRRAIVRDIRRIRPDVLMMMNHREQEPDGGLNDADHRAMGTATLDAVRSSANQWAFRDVGEPHIVNTVLVAASPAPTHAIDVSGFEDDAVRAFSAHRQHLESVADHPLADPSWLASALKSDAQLLSNSQAAVTVERIEFAQGRLCHSSIVKEFTDEGGSLQIKKLSDKPQLSKTPTRARNAAPTEATGKKTSRKSKTKTPKTPTAAVNAMKFKVRLEQRGRSIGVEVPESVMERLGGKQRPAVMVEVNDTKFETTISTSNGQRFIAINAQRRKAAGVDIDDIFFLALSTPANTADPVVTAAPSEQETTGHAGVASTDIGAESPPTTNSEGHAKKRNRRKRSSRSRSKASAKNS